MNKTPPENKIVRVKVKKVVRNGLEVQLLEDNSIGFIPNRELSWDRSIHYKPRQFKIGEELKVNILIEKSSAHNTYLSLKEVETPWANAQDKYAKNQVIIGEVVNLRLHEIFVQIEAGIDAIIRHDNLPLKKNQAPSDVLNVGDKIEGIITKIDYKNHHIEVNLLKLLKKLSNDYINRPNKQAVFFRNYNLKYPSSIAAFSNKNIKGRPLENTKIYPPLQKLENILLIDDDEYNRNNISKILKQEFQVKVSKVATGKEAIAIIKQDSQFDLVVVDISLREENGIYLANQLASINSNLYFLFISSNPMLGEKVEETFHGRFPFAIKYKDFSEIIDWVSRLKNGYLENNSPHEFISNKSKGNFIQQLGMNAFVENLGHLSLVQILQDLKKTIAVSHLILLKLSPDTREVNIVQSLPDIVLSQQEINELYFSPVRQVIEYNQAFYESYILTFVDKKFKYFFPQINYSVCYGIPIIAPSLSSPYALFIFDKKKREFNKWITEKVLKCGKSIQFSLERQEMLGFMQKYEEYYSRGQLLGSLMHDLKGKLDGIHTYTSSLKAEIEENLLHKVYDPTPLLEITNIIDTANQDIMGLIEGYSSLARKNFKEENLNQLIEKVIRQLKMIGLENLVKIQFKPQENLPHIWTVAPQLERVLSNVIHNAIQQINIQAEKMMDYSDKSNKTVLKKGWIIVEAKYNPINHSCQVLITDTGPGIPYYQQDSIFNLGVSTRKTGQGLGLFISRTLMDALGGNIYLEASIIFIGSIFLIEIPIKNNETKKNS